MKIFKNYLYNLTYQLVVILIPIITTPYVSRVLEVDGVGKYAFSTSIINYFVIFGMLGISTYGNRQIAYVRDDNEQLSKVFWEIFLLKLVTMSVSIVGFYIYIQMFITHEDYILYSIQIFTLLASLIDISWFFYGIEEFKKTATRNILVKLISTILIFVFVEGKSDIWLYALIISGSTFVGQIVIWKDVHKKIIFIKPNLNNLIIHLKNTLLLWLPSLSIQVYSSIDKVMLGIITNTTQVGLYENSQKLVRMAATVATALAAVTMPRISNSFKNNDTFQIQKVSNKSFSMISMVSIPMAFGIMAVRETLVPWFYGPGYEEIVNLLCINGWIIISLGWSSVFGAQILIGCRKEKEYTIAVSIGALLNIILNSFFIVNFEAVGAIFASVVAEFAGMFIMLYFVRKIISISEMFSSVKNYFIASIIMYTCVYYTGKVISISLVATVVQVVVGSIIYFIILFILKDKNFRYFFTIFLSLFRFNNK